MRNNYKSTFCVFSGRANHCLLLFIFLLITSFVSAQPVIISFSPTTGPAGTPVIIKGTGFSSVAADNIVYFGKTKATVTAATTTSLSVIVPISADFLPITVTTNNLTAYSAKPFITTFRNCSEDASIAFEPKIDLQTNDKPNSILLADLDGDGKPDAFNTYNDIPNITISRNISTKGKIVFEKAKDLYNNGFRMTQVRAEDIDGDGKQDLLAVNLYDSSVSIFLNKSTPGSFNFSAPYYIHCGVIPYDVSIGDLDGDGKPEIVIPRRSTGDLFSTSLIKIYKNGSTPGQLSFSAPFEIVTSDIYTFKIVIHDLDNDNKPELLAMNNWTYNVTIYKNSSTVNNFSFTTTNILSTEGLYPKSIAVSDLDDDGKPDIVLTTYTSIVNQVNVFRNTTENNFISFGPKQNFYANKGTVDCFLGDLDGDKKLDIAVASFASVANSVSIYQNTSVPGKISFAPTISLPTARYPEDVYINDVDGDGRADIAATAYLGNAISFLRNNEPQKPIFTTTITPSTCTSSDGSISNGSISIKPSDDETYTYSSDGIVYTTSSLFNYLKSNTYIIYVKNAAGCVSTDTIFVPGTGGPTFTVEPISNVCKTENSLKVHITSGTAPYKFTLDGINYQDNNAFDNLAPGDYTITIKDANGCASSQTISIEDIDLSLNVFITNATCGVVNGMIEANTVGGAPPYLYSLNESLFSTNNVFNALAAGTYVMQVKDANGCLKDTTITLTDGCLNIAAQITHTTCGNENGKIIVNTNSGTAPFLFSLDGQNFQVENEFKDLKAGNYEVTVRDLQQLQSSIQVIINESTVPRISGTATEASCLNNDASITIEGSCTFAPYKYSLDGNVFGQYHTFDKLPSGEYTAYIEDAKGCISQTQITVSLKNTLQLNVNDQAIVCEGASVKLNATSNATSYSWAPSSSLDNPFISSPTAMPVISTDYKLTATLGSCVETRNVLVTVLKAPKPDGGNDITICKDQDGKLEATEGFIYNWKTSLNLNDASIINPIVLAPPPGRHAILLDVFDNNGCKSLVPDTVNIFVINPIINLGKDTFILASTPLQLNANDPNALDFVKYTWTPSTGLNVADVANPIAMVDNDITYSVIAETRHGCIATDDIQIKVLKSIDIYVPNAFTPNNDGLNDILKAIPAGIKNFIGFSIWNRWGQLVFTTSDPNTGWNGLWKNSLQDGVFVWVAEAIDYNGNKISRKGTVLLIR